MKQNQEKPNNIPDQSFFLGGLDGGVWIDSTSVEKYIVSYTVFSEGGQILDTCYIKAKDKSGLVEKIKSVIGYNGEDLVYKGGGNDAN